MGVNIIKGDLIKLAKEGEFDIIAHGANCQNIMGAGIAKEIVANFYSAFEADKLFPIPVGSPQRLGCFSGAAFNNLYVLNFYTQFNTGKNFELNALEMCLEKLHLTGMLKGGKTLGLPKIGCGIGGGNWEEVKELITNFALKYNYNITIVDYE